MPLFSINECVGEMLADPRVCKQHFSTIFPLNIKAYYVSTIILLRNFYYIILHMYSFIYITITIPLYAYKHEYINILHFAYSTYSCNILITYIKLLLLIGSVQLTFKLISTHTHIETHTHTSLLASNAIREFNKSLLRQRLPSTNDGKAVPGCERRDTHLLTT